MTFYFAKPKAVLPLAVALGLVLGVAGLTWLAAVEHIQGWDSSLSMWSERPQQQTTDPDANAPPEFSGPFDFIVAQGNVAVGTVAATDPDGDAITNYVKRGPDGHRFRLVKENGRKTGELVFREAPDYENPVDADGDNVYHFTIQAHSGTGERKLATTVDVTVTVVEEQKEEAQPPATPANLTVASALGILDVAAWWDATDHATSYRVRWRQRGAEFQEENETNVTDPSADVTVSGYGDWELEAQACNDAGCGPGAAAQFTITPAAPSNLELMVLPRTRKILARWNAAPGASYYRTTWRHSDGGEGSFNVSDAIVVVEVAFYGNWDILISGCSDDICGPPVSGSIGIPPPRPQNLTVTTTPGDLNLSATWDAVEGASSYQVRWKRVGESFQTGNHVRVVDSNASFAVPDYGDWNVWVSSCGEAGCGQSSYWTGAVAGGPGAPSNLAVGVTPGDLTLSVTWDPATGASSYRVRWKLNGGDFQPGNEVSVADTSASITVSGYGNWEIHVHGCDGAGDVCGAAAVQTVNVVAPPVQPAALSSLHARVAPERTSVLLWWGAADGATFYKLRWRGLGGNFEPADEVSASRLRAAVTVSDFGEWEFQVRGCNDSLCGPAAARTIELEPPNAPPAFTGASAFTVAENGVHVGTVTATDPDDEDDVTGYAISGADARQFRINGSGEVAFNAAPDHESPSDAGGDNVYRFTVTATGGSGDRALTASQDITVTVADVAEPPAFLGPFEFTVDEGSVAVGAVAATDPDGDAVTNYVKRGPDGHRFRLVKENGRKTGELEFREAPDFENPADADGDNVYHFVIQAVSGTGEGRHHTTRAFTITVTDAAEPE